MFRRLAPAAHVVALGEARRDAIQHQMSGGGNLLPTPDQWADMIAARPELMAFYGPQIAISPDSAERAAAFYADARSRGLMGPVGHDASLGQARAFGSPPYPPPTQGNVRSWDYRGVEFTIDTMRRLVKNALTQEQSMAVRRLAERIVAGVYPKDYLSEVAAIYYWVLVNLRYVRDPAHIELVQSPLQVLQPMPADVAAGRRAAQEDCESISTVLAALVMSIGNRAEFVTISTQRGVGYHHVFCVVQTPDGQKVVLDPIPGPLASQMLRSVILHQAWPIEPVMVPGRAGWIPAISGRPDERWGRSLHGAGLDREWTVAAGPAHELAGSPWFAASWLEAA